MQITIDIPDDVLVSVEEYLDTQRDTIPNEAGSVVSRRRFQTVEDFVEHQMGSLLKSIVDQYPTPAMAEKVRQIRALNEDLHKTVKPKVRKAKP